MKLTHIFDNAMQDFAYFDNPSIDEVDEQDYLLSCDIGGKSSQ